MGLELSTDKAYFDWEEAGVAYNLALYRDQGAGWELVSQIDQHQEHGYIIQDKTPGKYKLRVQIIDKEGNLSFPGETPVIYVLGDKQDSIEELAVFGCRKGNKNGNYCKPACKHDRCSYGGTDWCYKYNSHNDWNFHLWTSDHCLPGTKPDTYKAKEYDPVCSSGLSNCHCKHNGCRCRGVPDYRWKA